MRLATLVAVLRRTEDFRRVQREHVDQLRGLERPPGDDNQHPARVHGHGNEQQVLR